MAQFVWVPCVKITLEYNEKKAMIEMVFFVSFIPEFYDS